MTQTQDSLLPPPLPPREDPNQIPVAPADVDLVPPVVRSLVTLLRLHGKGVSPKVLMGGSVAQGITPAEALRAARHVGLDGRIVRRNNLDEILPLTLPCVLLLTNKHTCVLTAFDQEHATVIFPEDGESPKQVPLEDLDALFMGYVIFATPISSSDRRTAHVSLLKTKRWFWDVLLNYWPIYRHVVIASVIINVVGVGGSLFAMNVYDRVVPNNAIETLWVLATGISLAYLCDFALKNLRSYFVDVAGRNADVVLSSKLVDKVLTMRFDKKPESTGALVNNLREFESLRDFFSSSTLITFVDLPFLALFLFLTWYIGGILVLVPLAAIPVMIGSGLLLQYRARHAAEQGFRQGMQKNALLVEMINGLETIKCTMSENRMRRLWERTVGISALASSQSRRYANFASSFAASVSQLVTVAMIVWGVYLIAAGQLTMGGLIGCNILVGRAMAPLMQLTSMISRLHQSRMALASLDLIMNTPSENQEKLASVDFGNLSPSLTFEKVVFQYPGAKRPSLDGISLHIRPGERVGVVGRMGSGKSTLGKLAVGLYTPQDGTVRFGDVDIRQMDTADVRGRVGFLPQDVVLFYGTVRDNIALGDTSVSDRLILRAAQLAGVTDFLRNNAAGFGAEVGERGMNLSGGQRQSIALARAVMHDPDVLILDEPTSNMDNVSETIIRAHLQRMLPGKTLLLITHRFSMLDLVDRLIVMEDGHIVADGPKEQVLKNLQAGAQKTKDPASGEPNLDASAVSGQGRASA